MVNRCLLHDRTGLGLFAMMQTTDVTIVPGKPPKNETSVNLYNNTNKYTLCNLTTNLID